MHGIQTGIQTNKNMHRQKQADNRHKGGMAAQQAARLIASIKSTYLINFKLKGQI